MGRPTPEELAERRRQMAAVNSMGRGGALPAAPNTTGSPALAGQAQSITGVNPVQAAQSATVPQTSLPASAPGGGVNGARTPVASAAQESQAGAGNSWQPKVDPSALIQDRGTPEQYLMVDLVDRNGPEMTIAAAETAGARVLKRVSDEETAMQVASVSDQMGIADEATADKMRNMFGEKFKEVTSAKVESGAMTPSQKKKQDKKFTNLFGGMSRQELGLFLFEYGSIMMANGDKGLGGAAGSAGIGALASLQERRRYATLAETEAAERQRKADLEERKMKVDERKAGLEEAKAAGDVLETDQGIFPFDPKTGTYSKDPLLGPDGKPLMPKSVMPDQGVKAWEIQQWRKAFPDLTEQEATELALSGVKPAEAELDAKQAFSQERRTGSVFIPGKGEVRSRNLTDADRNAYIADFVRNRYGPSTGAKPALTGGGGGGGGGGGALPTRREDVEAEYGPMTDEEWTQYEAMMKQAGQ